jgi:hypothetical protein
MFNNNKQHANINVYTASRMCSTINVSLTCFTPKTSTSALRNQLCSIQNVLIFRLLLKITVDRAANKLFRVFVVSYLTLLIIKVTLTIIIVTRCCYYVRNKQ